MKGIELRPFVIRGIIILAISLVFALIFNEATFLIAKDPTDRGPTTFTVDIPSGTSARLAAGEQMNLLPDDINFVVGDVLAVKNDDSVTHQLGPIWVPPGSTGRLIMDNANRYSYRCSFQSNQYLGFEVHSATTWSTRLTALGLTVPTLGVLIFLYSLALYPIKTEAKKANI